MIATDEIEYTINRCGLVVNNSSSEEERFVAIQVAQALQQLLQRTKQLEMRPDIKELASEFFKNEVNNDT